MPKSSDDSSFVSIRQLQDPDESCRVRSTGDGIPRRVNKSPKRGLHRRTGSVSTPGTRGAISGSAGTSTSGTTGGSIGASTGGIHALSELLRAIPAEFRLPILVTQHLPAAFMPYFAAQLAVIGGRPCDVACDRMRVRPGRVRVRERDDV